MILQYFTYPCKGSDFLMKKNLVVLAIIAIVVGSMGFGVMIGVTYDYDTIGGGTISLGTEIGNNAFMYGGISFPFGLTAGGGMKLGNIYATDLGTTTENKKIGKLDIGYGAVASAGVEFSYSSIFGAFAGPALFVNFESQLPGLKGKIMEYTALGPSFKFGEYYFPISFDFTSGLFYYF